MKSSLLLSILAATVLVWSLPGGGAAQTIPPSGFSLGGFYEYRTENEINGDNVSFHQYGGRIQFRDRRWIELFIDLGGETLSFDPVKDKTALTAGIGAYLWLVRQEYGYGVLDIGLYGSGYYTDFGDVEYEATGVEVGLKHYRYAAQLALRSRVTTNFDFYLRGGVLGTYLDPEEGDSEDDTKPAVNAGFVFKAAPRGLYGTVELNYYDGIGAGIQIGYWF